MEFSSFQTFKTDSTVCLHSQLPDKASDKPPRPCKAAWIQEEAAALGTNGQQCKQKLQSSSLSKGPCPALEMIKPRRMGLCYSAWCLFSIRSFARYHSTIIKATYLSRENWEYQTGWALVPDADIGKPSKGALSWECYFLHLYPHFIFLMAFLRK